MYRIEGLIDDPVSFDPGASLLLTGTSLRINDRVVDVVAQGVRDEEAAIFITTNDRAEEIVEGFRRRDALASERVGIIDSTGQDEGETTIEGVPVEYLGSPGDLTGMSLEFAKLHDRLEQGEVADRTRIGMASVSTVLMYSNTQTTFRFLHVFSSRIRSGDMFGVFTLDTEMHDDQTLNTIRAVFDAEARIDESGDVDLQGSGYVVE